MLIEIDRMEQHNQAGQPESALELMNRFQQPEIRHLLAELPLPRGSSGVDVGCGIGLYALWLADVVANLARKAGDVGTFQGKECVAHFVGGITAFRDCLVHIQQFRS